MAIEKILIVDDEMLVRDFLAETLKRKGLDVTTAENGQKAISAIKETSFDMIICDMKMPDMTGIDVLRKVKEVSPETLFVVITAFGSIENAVEAIRLGAFNYLIKPFSPDTIEAMIEKGNEHRSLVEENRYLRQQVSSGSTHNILDVVAESPAMKSIVADVESVAKSNASVFITGESGTGKEVIAHLIHYRSLRSSRPFIKVNCAAIPDTLIESEFFGHEKGSFTGANAKRLGRFELANTGTLLLDEVTEIPPVLQAKLLRVCQEQEFERVGGTKPVKVDVRLISTSNRNIKEAIAQKVLREDLYYRLNVVPIHLPPLRERKGDILPLAHAFIQRMCRENHKEMQELTESAVSKLLSYSWPGNVRELANIIERAVVMSASSQIEADSLILESSSPLLPHTQKADEHYPAGISLRELERRQIIKTLKEQQNNRKKTAEVLGISERTLRNKIHEYNLKSE